MSTRLFGRAWKVQVLTPPDNASAQTLLTVSSSDAETQSLRVTFDIQQLVGPELWYAEVTIYNPNLQTMQHAGRYREGVERPEPAPGHQCAGSRRLVVK
jgi:hypothetical protein